MNILDLITKDGYILKRQASTHGGEYAGSCPWCGGKDRFRVWPEKKRYWCRQCGKHGDCIQYLKDYKGLTYRQACHELNVAPKTSWNFKTFQKSDWTPRQVKNPEKLWQHKAEEFVKKSQNNIPVKIKEWLYKRGLNDKVIKKGRLGWNSKDLYLSRKVWGLSDEISDQTKKLKKLWIPQGLVIPYIVNKKIIRLRIRRTSKDNRYIIVSGSDTRPMVWKTIKEVVMIVESELDGFLVHEKAKDLVSVISLGNAQSRPDKYSHKILKDASVIFLALDSDDAGAKESWQWWPEHYENIVRWPCPLGKDPGEGFEMGLDVRVWVEVGLMEFIL